MEFETPKQVGEHNLNEQFLLNGEPVPFPIVDPENGGYTTLRNQIELVWPLASEDFIKIYESNYGTHIRDAIERKIYDNALQLEEIGELIGLSDFERLRKIRSALQLGEIKQNGHKNAGWKFNKLEFVQYMIGILGRRYFNEFKNQITPSQEKDQSV